MSAVAISSGLRSYAVKRWPTANHKFRKARLADILGLSERRVRSYWEAKAASPREEEVDAIKALIGQEEEANAAADSALAKRIADLETQVATLMAALASDALEAEGRASRGSGNGSSGRSPSVPRRRHND